MLAPIAAAFASAACVTAKDTVSKQLASRVDGTISAFASFVYALPFYFAFLGLTWALGYENFAVGQGFFYWILLRSFSDAFFEWFKMHALHYGDLSVVSALLSLYPVLLLIASPFLTGDRITTAGALGVLITIAGTLIILYQPADSGVRIHPKALAFSLLAIFCATINTCCDRLAAQTASAGVSGFAMTFLAAIFLLPMLRTRRQFYSQFFQFRELFFRRGFFEICFMVVKLYALQHLQAAYVVGLQRVSVLFSVVTGRIVFREGDFLKRLIGAFLIIFGVAVILVSGF